MNKIQFVVMRITLIAYLFGFVMQTAWTNDNSAHTTIEKQVLKERIETLYSPVDLRYTEEVHTIINTYIKKYRKGSERLLGLSERFFPLYESEFARQGLPEELKYLSVVESGLRPNVVSHAGAVGLWQFMKGTSKLYGLTSNSVVDERRDPIRSTQAATLYLKDLYAQFGDWTLALAAYNCGPGNVKKALRRSSKSEFWGLKNYLPKETRRYIPKYVAISYMMSYSHAHGLSPLLDFDANTLVTLMVYDYTPLSEIGKVSGMDLSAVKEFNPAFLKNYIPKSTKGYLLTLPEVNMYNFLAQKGGWENVLPMKNHSASLQHTYFRYGAMKKQLDELVPLQAKQHSFNVEGFRINSTGSKVPVPIEKVTAAATLSTPGRFHKLKAQQSLSDVARLMEVSLNELIALNNIDINNPPPAGSLIRVE